MSDKAISSAVSSSSEPVASATTGGAQRPQDLASASSCLDANSIVVTDEMREVGARLLRNFSSECYLDSDYAEKIYREMQRLRPQELGTS